ncbi:hypothetical protein HDU93_001185, partial [Gonapodya sp. JEL0774]
MSQRIAIYITDSSLPPTVLSTLPPNAVKGNIPILDDLVPTSELLHQLCEAQLTSRYPALSPFIHAFRFRVDQYKRYDLPRKDSVQDAVADLPRFLKKQIYPRNATAPLKHEDPLDLRVVTKLQYLKEINKYVLGVEKAYWNHFGAIKYLESRPRPPSPPQIDANKSNGRVSDDSEVTESGDSESTNTDGTYETDSGDERSEDDDTVRRRHTELIASHCQSRSHYFTLLRTMMTRWRTYAPVEQVTTFAATLPSTTNTDDTSPQMVQLWLKYMRSVKAEPNRVPKDLSEKFLPFLRERLHNPPEHFTVLWESENSKFPSTGTMAVIGELTGEERKTEYLRIKTAQLADITEQEIREVSEREEEIEGVRVSRSFMSNRLVEVSFGSMYPERTDKAASKSLVAVWDMLSEEEKRTWWRRDAWELKQKGSNTTEKDVREPVPPVQTTRVGRVSAIPVPPNDPSFTVTSGMIYWGHLGTIAHAGVVPSSYTDGPEGKGLPKRLTGGTILQHSFRYRAHARNGTWKVAQVSANSSEEDLSGDGEEDMRRIGWIVYHESVDPGESVLRASGIYRISGNGDNGVLKVGRYDWSGYWDGASDPVFASYFSSRFHNEPEVGDSFYKLKEDHVNGHLAVIDAGGFSFDMLDCGMT